MPVVYWLFQSCWLFADPCSALRAYCETRSLPPSVVEEAAQVLREVEGAEECVHVRQALGQWAGQYRQQRVQESSPPVTGQDPPSEGGAGQDPPSGGGASVVGERLQELERRLEAARALVRSHRAA